MTDYELASLFTEYASVPVGTFINFVSAFFAFLLATYLVSSVLTSEW